MTAPTSGDAAPAASPGVDTEEQAALRQSVASLLEKKSDSAAVRAAMNSDDGYDPALWSTLVEQIGAAALSIPEESGGAGATWIETHLVCEELGRRLTPSPMLGSAVLSAQAVIAAGDAEACARLLPGIAAGEQVALCWAGAGGWATTGVRADSPADSGPVSLTGTAHHVLGADTASTLLVVAVTGESVGLFELPADAAAYAAEIEAAAAKVYCSEALQWITGESIQLHGGVGITWEYDTHLFFKRAHGTAQLLGQPHEILSALEEAAGL